MSRRALSAPPELAGFTFIEPLGMGGFADVFKYEQSALRRQVAVKVLLHNIGSGAQASFEAEANQMAMLSNHPSIVSIYQAGAAPDGRPFLVMEYCPPPSLATRIKSRQFPVSRALVVGIQLAGAVETAHRLGILHRDIKPANILFTQFGRAALTDFGISTSTGQAAEGNASGVSVPWAPPEQLSSGQAMSPASDVYSLGATLYAMLSGHSPFEVAGGNNQSWALAQRVRTETAAPIDRKDVPESLERVLRTSLAKRPSQRYSSAIEFARALQTVQAELHQTPTAIDVLDNHSVIDDDDYTETDGGTRFSEFVTIVPDTSVGSQASKITPTVMPAYETSTGRTSSSTVAEPVALEPATASKPTAFVKPDAAYPETMTSFAPVLSPAASTEPKKLRRNSATQWWLWPIAGLCVIVIVVSGIMLGKAIVPAVQPSMTPSSYRPIDPLVVPVPKPSGLTVQIVDAATVQVSWKNPEPQAGDSYLYRVADPTSPDTAMTQTSQLSAVVARQPGRTCVEVVLRRTDGRGSEPSAVCTKG